MREPAQVAPGRAVIEVELDLLHLEAGTDGVDRHPRLDPEAHRNGEHGRAGARGQVALPRERLTRREPAAQPDQRARRRLREPEAAADARRERRDRELGLGIDERPQVATEIGVAEQERPRLELPLRERQRLPLAPSREPDHASACLLGALGGRIAGAVVGDDDQRLRELRAEPLDRCTDPALLVTRCDEHRQPVRVERVVHPCGWTGGIDGSTPSWAVSPTP